MDLHLLLWRVSPWGGLPIPDAEPHQPMSAMRIWAGHRTQGRAIKKEPQQPTHCWAQAEETERLDMSQPKAFSHDRVENTKHEWLTPPEIIKTLGPFDLDVCSPIPSKRPWATALEHYDINDDGLQKKWKGRVWLNPPYENKIAGEFLKCMAQHGNGIVLIFARTETANWFEHIWSKADAILFVRGRLQFYHASGKIADNSGGAPSALIAYGDSNVEALRKSGIEGHLVVLDNKPKDWI